MPHAAARAPQPTLPPAGRPQPHRATVAGQGAPAAASPTLLRERPPKSEMASSPPFVPFSAQESMAEMPQWHASLRESHNQLQDTMVKLRRDFQCHERWAVARDLEWRRRSEAAEKAAEDLSVDLALAKCPPVPKSWR